MKGLINRAPMAQLVEHREVVSSTPAGPTLRVLRTFAPKSPYGEIFFISRLELVDKVLTPKIKKNGGHRLCFGENGSGKMP